MGLKVRLHERAERDLQDIHDYLVREAGAVSAERVRAELHGSINRLATHPFLLGRPTPEPEIRILSLTRYPYLVYYTVTATAVLILHIRHSARLNPDLGELAH